MRNPDNKSLSHEVYTYVEETLGMGLNRHEKKYLRGMFHNAEKRIERERERWRKEQANSIEARINRGSFH